MYDGIPSTEKCPLCGSPVEFDADCPGYKKDGTNWHCYPRNSCGNAFRYECTKCDWWWINPADISGDSGGPPIPGLLE